jgi:hypothetical protein
MHSRLVLLLCLAGLAGVAVATRDLSADGRGLLQTEADCKRSIDYCSTCRYAFFHGTVTKAICLSCDTGYVVAEEGRKCCEWLAGGAVGWGPGGCCAQHHSRPAVCASQQSMECAAEHGVRSRAWSASQQLRARLRSQLRAASQLRPLTPPLAPPLQGVPPATFGTPPLATRAAPTTTAPAPCPPSKTPSRTPAAPTRSPPLTTPSPTRSAVSSACRTARACALQAAGGARTRPGSSMRAQCVQLQSAHAHRMPPLPALSHPLPPSLLPPPHRSGEARLRLGRRQWL